MSIIKRLLQLAGTWQATYRVWLAPGKTPLESPSGAIVSPMVNGKMVCLEYSWMVDDSSQEGEIFIGYETKKQRVTLIWADSWHNGDRFMICQGEVSQDEAINVLGSYPAPEGPDWGWRVVIEPGDDRFWLRMYNIPPGGTELLAVEAAYTRGELP